MKTVPLVLRLSIFVILFLVFMYIVTYHSKDGASIVIIPQNEGQPTILIKYYRLHNPPPIYKEYAREIELCSHAKIDYESIEWYVADSLYTSTNILKGIHFKNLKGVSIIVIRKDYADTGYVIRHELLHEAINDGKHESILWKWCRVGYNYD